jgi:hypothetical protein
MQLLAAGERIEELRAAIEKKKEDEKIARSLLSVAEAEFERVLDSGGGPVRRLREKISRLNIRIRELSGDDVCAPEKDNGSGDDEGDIENLSFDDDEDIESIIRRHSKIGSYKKRAGVASVDQAALDKYKQRKIVEFENAVDRLFSKALGNGEGYNQEIAASRERGEDAFQWVLYKVLIKRPKLWSHLLLEKRTV